MHVASEYYYWTPAVFGAVPLPVVEANKAGLEKFEKMSPKPEVLKHLKEGFVYGRQAPHSRKRPGPAPNRRPPGVVLCLLRVFVDSHFHRG